REKGLAAALQSHPSLVEVRLELAQLRWADAGPQAAAALLQSDRTRGPHPPSVGTRRFAPPPPDPRLLHLLAAAQRLMGREDLAQATQRLESIAESEADPEVWVALARLSLRQMETGGNRETLQANARTALQRALALRPRMPRARQLLGRWQRLSGDSAAARATLE